MTFGLPGRHLHPAGQPCPDPPDVRHPHELGHEVCGRGVSTHLAQGAFCVWELWYTENDNSEFD